MNAFLISLPVFNRVLCESREQRIAVSLCTDGFRYVCVLLTVVCTGRLETNPDIGLCSLHSPDLDGYMAPKMKQWPHNTRRGQSTCSALGIKCRRCSDQSLVKHRPVPSARAELRRGLMHDLIPLQTSQIKAWKMQNSEGKF